MVKSSKSSPTGGVQASKGLAGGEALWMAQATDPTVSHTAPASKALPPSKLRKAEGLLAVSPSAFPETPLGARRSPHFTDGNAEACRGAALCRRKDDKVIEGLWSPSLSPPSPNPLSLTSGRRCHSPTPSTPRWDSSSSLPAQDHPLHLTPAPFSSACLSQFVL